MGQHITYRTDAGETRAYLALPSTGSGPGLVVIQEWWGLVDHIRDVCDRFAAEGFVALAPDLYKGERTEDSAEADRLMQELQVEEAALELVGAIGELLQREDVTSDQVGVVGYCMGGALALVTAEKAGDKVAAADSYYGVFWYGEPEFSHLSAAVTMRVGTEDAHISVDHVESLAEHIRSSSAADVRVMTYEGAGHAFFNDDGAAYDEDAARSAWKDTLEFFRAAGLR